jgi:hypothetical protein
LREDVLSKLGAQTSLFGGPLAARTTGQEFESLQPPFPIQNPTQERSFDDPARRGRVEFRFL